MDATTDGPDPVFGPAALRPAVVVALLLVLLTLAIEVPAVREVLPRGPLGWLRRNSEAWVAAALLLVDLWWVDRRTTARSWQWWWLAVVAMAVFTAVVARTLGASDRVVTLQESFAAVVVLSPLVRWGREGVTRRVALGVAGVLAVTCVLVAGFPVVRLSVVGQAVVDQAETVAMVALALTSLLAVHRWPGRVGGLRWRVPWIALLVLAPVAFATVERVEPGGVRFAQRTTESFLAVLVIVVVVEVLDLLRRSVRLSAARPVSTRSGTGDG